VPSPETRSITVGETFERYTIEALIGRGGMGEVYRALDTRLRRKVALKVLRPDRAAGEGGDEAVARLFREARAAAGLTHPHTVAIHDIGEADGIFYIVMELVTGASLLAHVGNDRASVARKLGWLVDVARALAAAHRAGIIHRDVKPSNVMVSDEGVAKVLDFGLAKPLAPVSFRTQRGHVLGTPRYMAPEQLGGREVDARTDQYAYGVMGYELVSGVHPGSVLDATPIARPLSDLVPEITPAIAAVIARAMSTRPNDRFASMDDVAVALDDAIRGKPAREVDEGEVSTVSAPLLPKTDAADAKSAAPDVKVEIRVDVKPDLPPDAKAGGGGLQGLIATARIVSPLAEADTSKVPVPVVVAKTLASKEAPSAIVRLGAAPPSSPEVSRTMPMGKAPAFPPTATTAPIPGPVVAPPAASPPLAAPPLASQPAAPPLASQPAAPPLASQPAAPPPASQPALPPAPSSPPAESEPAPSGRAAARASAKPAPVVLVVLVALGILAFAAAYGGSRLLERRGAPQAPSGAP